MFIHIIDHSLFDYRVKVFLIKFQNFFRKNIAKLAKKNRNFLALWVIKFLPPEHNAKNPISLGALVSKTLFFE